MANALDTILIETFGNARYMQSFLDGIVIMMDTHNTGDSPSLFMTITYVAMIFTISIGLLKIQRTDWWNYMLRLVIPCLLFVVLIKAEIKTVILDDVYDDSLYGGAGTYSVNNVPVGIALPLYITSLIEKTGLAISDHLNVFTGGFGSSAGSQINVSGSSLDIRQVDFFGPARAFASVVDPATVAIATNYSLVRTIGEYFTNCVLHGMSMNLIDPAQIMNSPDIFVDIATPYMAFFTTIYEESGASQVQTCFAAYNHIDTMLNSSSSFGGNVLSKAGAEVMVNAMKAEEMINGLYDMAYTGGGAVSQASQLIKNNIMIAAIQGALADGTPEAVAALSVGEAQSSQGMKASALLFIKKLPLMRSILQMVLICLFPLIAWSFVTQLGKPFMYWCSGLIWVSLFMPLEGIIHTVYMGTLVDELSSIIASHGVTWSNRQLVMNTLGQSAVVASGLFMMIFALSGMVTTWILPKAGSSISNMLSGASRIGMQIGSYGAQAGADVYSGKTGATMQREDLNQKLSGMSPSYNNLTDTWGDFYKSRSNQLTGFYGDGSMMKRNFGDASDQANGKMTLSEGSQAQRAQAFAEQKQAMSSQANNITDMVSKGMSHSGVKGFSETQNYVSSLGKGTQEAIRQSSQYQQAKSMVESWGKGRDWSSSDIDKVATAMAIGGKIGGEAGGIGADVSGRGTSDASTSNSVVASLSHEQREQANLMAQQNHERSTGSTKDSGLKTSEGVSTNSGETASDIESKIKSASESFSKTVSAMNSYGETISRGESNGFSSSIDVGELLTRTDSGVLQQMGTDNPSQYQNLNAALVNGNTSPQELAVAAAADYKAAGSEGRQEMANDIISRYHQSGINDGSYVSQMEDVAAYDAAGAFSEKAAAIQGAVNSNDFGTMETTAAGAAGVHGAMTGSVEARGESFNGGYAGATGRIETERSGITPPSGAQGSALEDHVKGKLEGVNYSPTGVQKTVSNDVHDRRVGVATDAARGVNNAGIGLANDVSDLAREYFGPRESGGGGF